MGIYMAGKYFPMLLQSLTNHFACAFNGLDFALLFYFAGQGIDCRQMLGRGSAPGNIL
jgi:hypothetical protein